MDDGCCNRDEMLDAFDFRVVKYLLKTVMTFVNKAVDSNDVCIVCLVTNFSALLKSLCMC